MPQPQHIGIYLRVSTRQQDTRSQEPDLERWVEAYAGDTEVRWYRDAATGKSMNRPAWNGLESAMATGAVSRLIVWRLDRLGRTAAGLTALFEDLQRRKVGFISLKDGVDLETAAGRLMANVLASVAAFETEIRSERVLAGQAAARAAGKKWGGSQPGRRKVTEDQFDYIKQMDMSGMSKTAMARVTGLSRMTIYSVLAE